ncbi:MAG: hypothetical protein AB8I08_03430 [Sandaracinaceae bacterium]
MATTVQRVREVESTDGRSRRASRELTRCMRTRPEDAPPWIALLAEIAEDFDAEGHPARAKRIRRRLRSDLSKLPPSIETAVLRLRASIGGDREAALQALSERTLEGREAALTAGWNAAKAWARNDGEAPKKMELAFYALGAQMPAEDDAPRHHEDLAWQADRISRWSDTLGRADDAVRWRRVALAFLTQAEQRPRLRATQAHHEEALGRMLLQEERYAEASDTLRAARGHADGEHATRIERLRSEAEAKAQARRDESGLK